MCVFFSGVTAVFAPTSLSLSHTLFLVFSNRVLVFIVPVRLSCGFLPFVPIIIIIVIKHLFCVCVCVCVSVCVRVYCCCLCNSIFIIFIVRVSTDHSMHMYIYIFALVCAPVARSSHCSLPASFVVCRFRKVFLLVQRKIASTTMLDGSVFNTH